MQRSVWSDVDGATQLRIELRSDILLRRLLARARRRRDQRLARQETFPIVSTNPFECVVRFGSPAPTGAGILAQAALLAEGTDPDGAYGGVDTPTVSGFDVSWQ